MRFAALVIFILVVLQIVEESIQRNAVFDTDILVYSVYNYEDGTTLYRYDTNSDETTILYHDDDTLNFVYGSNDRIAFSTGWAWKNNGELFILDTTKPDQPLINLSQEIDLFGSPLGWSADGSYLAFASEIDEGQRQALYIWDGTTATDITPQHTLGNPENFRIAWSNDGRLAFTVWSQPSDSASRSEIYLWDGEATLNLSQNADAEDREPVWNTAGELAFGSTLDNAYILLLWDGKSYLDGLPDASTFTRIAPQLRVASPFTTWVSDHILAFEVVDSENSQIQIYVWDRQHWTNMSQEPYSHNGGAQWSHDGYWAFVTDQHVLIARDAHNNDVLRTIGQYPPAWSSGGSLIFCSRTDRGDWKLSRWNRASLSTVIQGDIIYAQWRSGDTVVCSSG